LVHIKNDAPKKFKPGEVVVVCGMMNIDSEEVALAYDCVGSNWLYTVEFGDGSSIEVPECYLEPYHE